MKNFLLVLVLLSIPFFSPFSWANMDESVLDVSSDIEEMKADADLEFIDSSDETKNLDFSVEDSELIEDSFVEQDQMDLTRNDSSVYPQDDQNFEEFDY